MTKLRLSSSLLLLIYYGCAGWCMDDPSVALAQLPRVIRKQPVYLGKPTYLLVILGDDIATRHWLVVDGKTVYFDRNSNSDLTDPEDRIEADPDKSDTDELYFKIGDIRVGGLQHRNMVLTVSTVDTTANRAGAPPPRTLPGKALVGSIWGEFEVPGWKGRCAEGRVPRVVDPFDHTGYLVLEESLELARIVHFSSRWSVCLQHTQQFFQGTESHIILNVGSKGAGTGTLAKLGYEKVIPTDCHPKITLSFPPLNGTGLQDHQQTLKERC